MIVAVSFLFRLLKKDDYLIINAKNNRGIGWWIKKI